MLIGQVSKTKVSIQIPSQNFLGAHLGTHVGLVNTRIHGFCTYDLERLCFRKLNETLPGLLGTMVMVITECNVVNKAL